MRKIVIIHLLLAWLLLMPSSVYAALDPTRLAAIELASSQAKKTLEAQTKAQELMTTGHIWTKEEVEATTEFQREFNSYLDMFHDAISIAAEVYGIYYEVKQTSKNVKNINEVLADSPTNALALAFSAKRSVVYRNIVRQSLDIIMDIRKVTMEESKMTEWEKIKVISDIRPKLRKFNKQLQALTLALRYTSFTDVWNELLQRAYRINPDTKHNIIQECRRAWWDNAKSVR
jgi:hypothetical protein